MITSATEVAVCHGTFWIGPEAWGAAAVVGAQDIAADRVWATRRRGWGAFIHICKGSRASRDSEQQGGTSFPGCFLAKPALTHAGHFWLCEIPPPVAGCEAGLAGAKEAPKCVGAAGVGRARVSTLIDVCGRERA